MKMIKELIRETRFKLKESQTEFGKRFDMTHGSISYIESGTYEAPYRVIEFCLKYNGWTKEK